jgi:hypothetical protein
LTMTKGNKVGVAAKKSTTPDRGKSRRISIALYIEIGITYQRYSVNIHVVLTFFSSLGKKYPNATFLELG